MSNYTIENLVPVLNPESGVPAIRVGDQVFPLTIQGGGSTDFYKCDTVSGVTPEIKSPEDATGNTGTGYTISASSIFSQSYDAWKAFNGDTVGSGKGWFSELDNTGPQWIQIQFTNAQVINFYRFDCAYGAQEQHLSAWILQASNDDSTWIDLETVTGKDLYSGNTAYSSQINNSTAYVYYRIYFSGTGGYGCIGVQNMKLGYLSSVKTWAGYKAVFDSVSGTYSFEATATSDLTWTDIKPQVGKIYSGDLKVIVSSLDTGLPNDAVFYAPLSSYESTAVTGQDISSQTNVTYTTENGIYCAHFQSNSLINIGSVFANLVTGASFTASLWIKSTSGEAITFSPGQSGDADAGLHINIGNGSIRVTNSGTVSISAPADLSVWHHVLCVGDASTIELYIDGQLANSGAMWNLNPDSRLPYIGNNSYGPFTGYIAAVRLFSYKTSPSQIAALANEFTPTQA